MSNLQYDYDHAELTEKNETLHHLQSITNNGKIKANNATFPTDFLPITATFQM